MIKKLFVVALIIMMICISVSAEELIVPKRKSTPYYVTGNGFYAPEYYDTSDTEPCGVWPVGAFIYNWYVEDYMGDDYIGVDWVGDSTLLKSENISAHPDPSASKPPIFVVNCEEWVSLRKKPSASSSRVAKIDWGTRIDNWEICDSDFLYVEVGGKSGYISLDYLSFTRFTGNLPVTVCNCKDWVSLRAEPNSSSERLMKVPLGTEIEKWGYFGDFYSCEVDGVIGFIDCDYLEMDLSFLY